MTATVYEAMWDGNVARTKAYIALFNPAAAEIFESQMQIMTNMWRAGFDAGDRAAAAMLTANVGNAFELLKSLGASGGAPMSNSDFGVGATEETAPAVE